MEGRFKWGRGMRAVESDVIVVPKAASIGFQPSPARSSGRDMLIERLTLFVFIKIVMVSCMAQT